jgi:DNA-binding NarL/FixJ family response regulator
VGAFTYAKMGDISNCDIFFFRRRWSSRFFSKGANRMTAVHGIIVADDYILLRNELKKILENNGNFRVTGEAANGSEILHMLQQGIVPDALVLDLMMPTMGGIEVLTKIRQMGYKFPVLVLTMHKEPDLLCQAFLTGATGYMLKDGIADELVKALCTVLERKMYLSPTMKKELAKTCRILPRAGQPLPAKFKHCKESEFR